MGKFKQWVLLLYDENLSSAIPVDVAGESEKTWVVWRSVTLHLANRLSRTRYFHAAKSLT